jgi:hypothetical protein
MLDNNRELERKMDKILLIGKENNESEKWKKFEKYLNILKNLLI